MSVGMPRLSENPTLVARASVHAQCTMEAMSRTVNVTGWAHDALSRRNIAAQHDALQAAGRPALARVCRGAAVARALAQPLTATLDYVAGTGKASSQAPSIRAHWKLLGHASSPQAHAERLRFLGQQAEDHASHPARMGVYGDMLTTECRIRTRLTAPLYSMVGSAVGALGWCLKRPFHSPDRSLREAAATGAVWGASVGAGASALSMLASVSFWAVQGVRVTSAVLKGAVTLVGLAGGGLDLGAACLWGLSVRAVRALGACLWGSCVGNLSVQGADGNFSARSSVGSAGSNSDSFSSAKSVLSRSGSSSSAAENDRDCSEERPAGERRPAA